MPLESLPGPPESGRCFAFARGPDWLVYAPDNGLLFRTNAAAAQGFVKVAENKTRAARPLSPIEPTSLTISPTNACGQACVYCYGTPAHQNGRLIDTGFCRAGIRRAAGEAARQNRTLGATFHGLGEPTLAWDRFQDCVIIAEEEAVRAGARLRLSLCTGGQLNQSQGRFIADHFQEVEISLDGPREIQLAQRPRRDQGDSFTPAVQTAHLVLQAGRRVKIKATITEATAPKMAGITEFLAAEFGPGLAVDLGDMCALPWIDRKNCRPPSADTFIDHFLEALEAGQALGIEVGHPDVSLKSLGQHFQGQNHMCLTPFNLVTAFYDVPREGQDPPREGAYGTYFPERQAIVFDREKLVGLESHFLAAPCADCLCRNACGGRSGVRGRLPENPDGLNQRCRIRIRLAQELLGRAADRFARAASKQR